MHSTVRFRSLNAYISLPTLLLRRTYIELYFKVITTGVWNLFFGEHRVDWFTFNIRKINC